MKYFFVLTLIFTAFNQAKADDGAYKPNCGKQALGAIAKMTNSSLSVISVESAGLTGDGVDGLETIGAVIKDKDGNSNGIWFVTMRFDDCTIFQEPKLLNN